MPWERDADMRVRAQHLSARRVHDGNWVGARGTRDGALVTSDWLQALIIEGRGFCAGIGLLGDGEALQAAAITTLRPALWIRVPDKTTIIPFYGAIQVEDSGSTVFEVTIGFASSDVGNGSSDGADFGPRVLRSGSGRPSNCIARQEATGNVGADPDQDLWRYFTPVDTDAETDAGPLPQLEWNPRPGPVLVGPATLMMYIGSTSAPLVTAQFSWVEFETDEVV